MKRTFEVDPWHIITHKLDPDNHRIQESITSLGNEHMGMRGFFEEGYSGDTLPGIYLGGVWYPDKTRVGWWKIGYPKYFGKVINAVNFLKFTIFINNEKLDLAKDKITDFNLDLNMKNGILTRSFIVDKNGSKVRVKFTRFVSVDQKELSDQKVVFENVGNDSVEIKIGSQIDANVSNEDTNYGEKFWELVNKQKFNNNISEIVITKENNFNTPQFMVGMESENITDMNLIKDVHDVPLEVSNWYKKTLVPCQQTALEKRTIVVTSRDYDKAINLKHALNSISKKVKSKSYDELINAHSKQWDKRWQQADITIKGDDEAQQGIRFNLFQLFSTYYGNDPRLNIGPKGFTGEKYGGATYWDTEAFAIPVYLGITDSKVSRNLLLYRYNQLSGAYHNAKQQGLKGALFPMVTFNGIECHNEWEITFEEIHRNGDIAFAIYNYTRYTGDKTYLLNEGIKVLTELSKFWADRVDYSQKKQKYTIQGVTGPDEYENNVDNNWYTNYLALWTLKYTLETLKNVSPDVYKKLEISDKEKKIWEDIINNFYLPEDKSNNIFIENDGFLDKHLANASSIDKKQLPINQHWSWDRILRSSFIKQADVLQGIWDFIDDFTPEQKKANFDFYEPMTVHESSLSPSIHSVLAADLGYSDKAVEMYERTSRLDLDDYNNDTQDGLHITSMTGSWLSIVQGFAGMRVRDGKLHYNPFLPKNWENYSFRQSFRKRVIEVNVTRKHVDVRLISGKPIEIDVKGKNVVLH